MEETVQTRASPEKVWEAWERAHQRQGGKPLEVGSSKAQGFKYKVLAVEPGKSYSILWKTLFVRLLFTHTVIPLARGSEISYRVQIKGPFAWPVRWLLSNKIRRNLAAVLKAMAKQVENS